VYSLPEREPSGVKRLARPERDSVMKSGVCLAACAGLLGALNGCDSNVYVSQANRYGYADGASTEKPWSTGHAVSARAYVQTDGGTTTIEGVVDSDGGVVLSGVPDGPYVLELRDPPAGQYPNDPPYVVQYPIASGRHVRVGDDYWARADVPQATPHTGVALTATEATAFQQGDQLAIVSLRSYLYRTLNVDSSSATQMNGPADGATSTAAWTSNLEDMGAPYGSDASGLPSASAGDDLTLFHNHSENASASTDAFDPWSAFYLTRVVGRLDAQDATLVAGTTNAITGAFVAPTTASWTTTARASPRSVRPPATPRWRPPT
jgi:hypothetical protein